MHQICRLLFFLAILFSHLWAHGQPSRARPDHLVVDDTRFLSQEEHVQLEERLQEFLKNTGIELFFLAIPFAESSSIDQESRDLIRKWENGKPAIIVSFSRGENGCTLYPSPILTEIYPSDIAFSSFHSILRRAQEMEVSQKARLFFMIDTLIEKFESLHANTVAQTQKEQKILSKLQWSGFALLIALCLFMHWLTQRLTPILLESIQKTELPKLHMSMRLEAPFGGGKIASIAPSKASEPQP